MQYIRLTLVNREYSLTSWGEVYNWDIRIFLLGYCGVIPIHLDGCCSVWPEKSCQISIKVAQKWFH